MVYRVWAVSEGRAEIGIVHIENPIIGRPYFVERGIVCIPLLNTPFGGV